MGDVNIRGEFSKKLASDIEFDRLLRVFEIMIERAGHELSEVPIKALDSTQIPNFLLRHGLYDWGFTLDCVAFTENQIRKLLGGLIPEIYKQKGTIPGIVNVIRLLTGIEAEVTTFLDEGVWIIDESIMSEDTIIGVSNPSLYLFVKIDQDLTEAEADSILCIIDFMRVAGTRVILEYNNQVHDLDKCWEIGTSFIGDTEICEFAGGELYEGNYPEAGVGNETYIN